jgi:hypothetical protein
MESKEEPREVEELTFRMIPVHNVPECEQSLPAKYLKIAAQRQCLLPHLTPHQEKVVAWLSEYPDSVLSLEMSTGKSIGPTPEFDATTKRHFMRAFVQHAAPDK